MRKRDSDHTLEDVLELSLKRYVDFLQTKGYFDPGMDELELEDLPGISGLKALRVTIASKSEVDEPGPPDRPAAREIEKVLAAGQT